MTAPPLTIAIVGYGTAGQTAALMLSLDGHKIEVFEQAPELRPLGAGFLLQPTGMSVLWELGLLAPARALGRRIFRLYGENAAGRAVMDMQYAGLHPHLFGLGLQRGALFELLRNAWSGSSAVHTGVRVTSVDDQGRHIIDDRGGRHGPYDLVIAADGAASCLRRGLGEPRLDQPYPWGALWCLLPERGWPWPAELRQRYRAASKMIGMLPVGSRPGAPEPQLSFFWSLRTAEFERWPEQGFAAWKQEMATLWPQAAEWFATLDDPAMLARAAYRDATPRQWSRGRMVLVGDAAHAMSPQLGQGVNMALMDVRALRDALRAESNVEAALARYIAERQQHVAIYQFWSRWLTPIFQSDLDLVAKARDLALLPLGRMPGGRGQMLRVLTGTQLGWFGQLKLPPKFIKALGLPSLPQ